MQLTPDILEQVAQVCYTAQRELVLSRGLSALNADAPVAWVLAPLEVKHTARCRARMFLMEPTVPPGAPLEDRICAGIARAFRDYVEELTAGEPEPANLKLTEPKR